MIGSLEKDFNSRLNINLDDFLKEFHTWKQDVDKVIQQNVQLQEMLNEERRQLKGHRELEFTKEQENDLLHSTVKELQQTVQHLQDIEDTNRKLKTEVERLTSRSLQENQLHNEEIQNFKTSLQEVEMQCKNQLQEARLTFNQELKSKEVQFHECLSEKEWMLEAVQKEMSALKQNYQEETLKTQVQHRLQIIKLEEQIAKLQQKSTANSSNINQEIYRNKLYRVQEEYQTQLESCRKEIDSLKRQLLQQLAQQTVAPIETESISGKNVPRFNRKRKLYKPIEALLQPHED